MRFFAQNRRNWLITKLGNYFDRLHKGYENLDYDFFNNGEFFVLKELKDILEIETILDVGANKGEWSKIAANIFPQAQIYSFEVVPQTYKELIDNCKIYKSIKPYNVGLSDEENETDIYYSTGNSGLSTCVSGVLEKIHSLQTESIKVNLLTGDRFCSQQNIETVDYLKIDVEGYEPKVLKGFETLLQEERIKIIQFEYGYVNIATNFLLKDFYNYLGAYNMKIGKIYPNYLDFKDYRFQDENFYGPNYLAVNTSLKSVINALSG